MTTVDRLISAPRDAVASVLADPRTYDGVVVGSKRIRWFDARWPEPGTRFHHSIGLGLLHIRDDTRSWPTSCPTGCTCGRPRPARDCGGDLPPGRRGWRPG